MPPSKKRRLNFACTFCRSRKTRCDEGKPSCRACLQAGIACITVNNRHPDQPVVRGEAGQSKPRPGTQPLLTHPSANCDVRHSMRRHAVEADHRLGSYQGRLPLVRSAQGSKSVEIHTEWLRFALGRVGRHSTLAFPTLAASAIWHLPSSTNSLPLLPAKWHDMLESFLRGHNALLPLLDAEVLQHDAQEVSRMCLADFVSRRGGIALIQLYLAIVVGGESVNASGRPLFEYAKSMLGHIAAMQCPDAIKTVALLSVALRQADEVMSAWHTMGMAVRAALSHSVDSTSWKSLRTLQELMAFELGKSSHLTEQNHDDLGSSQSKAPSDLIASLASHLSVIGRQCVAVSQPEEQDIDVEKIVDAIYKKVRTVGEACLTLFRWTDSVPLELRPTDDFVCDAAQGWACRFISTQYHSAILMLTRNSLLINAEAIELAIEQVAQDAPWSGIIRNGPNIAANAARRLLRLELDTKGPYLNALLVLSVFVVTQPTSRLTASDTKLIESVSHALLAAHPSDTQLQDLLSTVASLVGPSPPTSQPTATNSQEDGLFAANWNELVWDWDMGTLEPTLQGDSSV